MDKKCEPKVEIAENGLSASLVLPEDFDRASLTPEVCESLLQRAGVVDTSIDKDAIEASVERAKAAPPGRFDAVIAEATAAIDGSDASIEWLADDVQEDSSNPDQSPDASDPEEEPACFYSQSIFTVVKTGDALGQVHTETLGTEGIDLRGKKLMPQAGKPLDFTFDETIGIDAVNHLVAQADGVLMRDLNAAHISDTIEVEANVDFSTGNIDFPGNVIVNQSVKDCFTVKASGDIEVRGLVEAATLIAGQDLHANGGFAGREQGIAEVQGNLYGKYLDAVRVHVAGDLCAEREIINCETTVLGDISSPTGSLIGGRTYASGAIELMDLGASAHPVTELHIGVLPQLDPLIARLSRLIYKMIDEREALLNEQEIITAHSGSRIQPGLQSKLNEISRAMGRLQLQLDRAEPALKSARERAESIRTIDVTIKRMVHPNALIVCGGYHYRITNEIKGPLRVTPNKRGQLEYQQGDAKPKLLSSESNLKSAA